jgi:hypothetical protein
MQDGSNWTSNIQAVMKTKVDMSITNEEFFKQSTCMYYTDEVQIKTIDNQKFVNEF